MENQVMIDSQVCKSCGTCVDICPNRIFAEDNRRIFVRQDHVWSCIRCGQCMAVCSTRAVEVEGLDYERDFFSLPVSTIKHWSQFSSLIDSRRSIRSFTSEHVDEADLDQIVQAVSRAPVGFTPIKTKLTVITDPQVLKRAYGLMVEFYSDLVGMMEHPIKRIFLRMGAGPEKFRVLQQHVVPLMKQRLPTLKDGTDDTIIRGAPVLILLHANRESDNFRTDIAIALTYGLLDAHALGLGACAIDLIPPAVDRSPALRTLLQIPDRNEVTAAKILGHPRHFYRRGIRRPLASVTKINPQSGDSSPD
jgi:ferredoxin